MCYYQLTLLCVSCTVATSKYTDTYIYINTSFLSKCIQEKSFLSKSCLVGRKFLPQCVHLTHIFSKNTINLFTKYATLTHKCHREQTNDQTSDQTVHEKIL